LRKFVTDIAAHTVGKSGVPEVGLLDSDNYWEWSRMEDLLIYKELDDCILRDAAQLAQANDDEKLRDRKALALIRRGSASVPAGQGQRL
jgi:hypothetical protein